MIPGRVWRKLLGQSVQRVRHLADNLCLREIGIVAFCGEGVEVNNRAPVIGLHEECGLLHYVMADVQDQVCCLHSTVRIIPGHDRTAEIERAILIGDALAHHRCHEGDLRLLDQRP